MTLRNPLDPLTRRDHDDNVGASGLLAVADGAGEKESNSYDVGRHMKDALDFHRSFPIPWVLVTRQCFEPLRLLFGAEFLVSSHKQEDKARTQEALNLGVGNSVPVDGHRPFPLTMAAHGVLETRFRGRVKLLL